MPVAAAMVLSRHARRRLSRRLLWQLPHVSAAAHHSALMAPPDAHRAR